MNLADEIETQLEKTSVRWVRSFGTADASTDVAKNRCDTRQLRLAVLFFPWRQRCPKR